MTFLAFLAIFYVFQDSDSVFPNHDKLTGCIPAHGADISMMFTRSPKETYIPNN